MTGEIVTPMRDASEFFYTPEEVGEILNMSPRDMGRAMHEGTLLAHEVTLNPDKPRATFLLHEREYVDRAASLEGYDARPGKRLRYVALEDIAEISNVPGRLHKHMQNHVTRRPKVMEPGIVAGILRIPEGTLHGIMSAEEIENLTPQLLMGRMVMRHITDGGVTMLASGAFLKESPDLKSRATLYERTTNGDILGTRVIKNVPGRSYGDYRYPRESVENVPDAVVKARLKRAIYDAADGGNISVRKAAAILNIGADPMGSYKLHTEKQGIKPGRLITSMDWTR
jgi:hypothetical protein